MPADLFIIHARKDRSTADAVARMLHAAGFPCVVGEWDRRRPSRSRAVVLLLSRDSEEVVDAVANVIYHQLPLFLLRTEACEPSERLQRYLTLGPIRRIEATPSLERGLRNLVRRLESLFGKPCPLPLPDRSAPERTRTAESHPERAPAAAAPSPEAAPPPPPAAARTAPPHTEPAPPSAAPAPEAAGPPPPAAAKAVPPPAAAEPPDSSPPRSPAGDPASRAVWPLADLPKLIGFFSYSRDDDRITDNALSQLKSRIENELQLHLTRRLVLWQDRSNIRGGTLWEDEIKKSISQSVFFIPVVTPNAVASRHCSFELREFLARERNLGRSDLVFPLLYIDVTGLHNEEIWRHDDRLRDIGARQYTDVRDLRFLPPYDPGLRKRISEFCDMIVQALRKSQPPE